MAPTRIFNIYTTIMVATSLVSGIGLQEWKLQPSPAVVNPGDTHVLDCIIKRKTGDCRWEKDGTPVGMFVGKYSWNGNVTAGDCSINILNIHRNFDHGLWQCSVTASSFPARDALVSKEVKLTVREPPEGLILRKGDTVIHDFVQVVERSNLTVSCSGEGGDPPARLLWRLPGQLKAADNPHHVYEELGTSILTVHVDRAHAGLSLVCEGHHPVLRAPLQQELKLQVLYVPTVKFRYTRHNFPVSNITQTNKLVLQEGESVTLTCEGESSPKPKVIWRKEGEAGVWNAGEDILIASVTREVRGVYSCTAQNQIGVSTPEIIYIDVEYSPCCVTTQPEVGADLQLGGRLHLTCAAEGNPPPIYQWIQRIDNKETIRGNEKTLIINNVSWKEGGQYLCMVTNMMSAGEQRHAQSPPVFVSVYGPPQMMLRSDTGVMVSGGSGTLEREGEEGSDIRLEVVFCGEPRPDVKWILGNMVLSPGARHGRFMLDLVEREMSTINCFTTSLYIIGAAMGDSHTYNVHIENLHGSQDIAIRLVVKDSENLLILVGGVLGCLLVIVLVSVLVLQTIRSSLPCLHSPLHLADINSEKTDIESSTVSSAIFLPTSVSSSSSQDCYSNSLHTFHTFSRGKRLFDEDISCGKYNVQSATLRSQLRSQQSQDQHHDQLLRSQLRSSQHQDLQPAFSLISPTGTFSSLGSQPGGSRAATLDSGRSRPGVRTTATNTRSVAHRGSSAGPTATSKLGSGSPGPSTGSNHRLSCLVTNRDSLPQWPDQSTAGRVGGGRIPHSITAGEVNLFGEDPARWNWTAAHPNRGATAAPNALNGQRPDVTSSATTHHDSLVASEGGMDCDRSAE